jgi:hypothetical protein
VRTVAISVLAKMVEWRASTKERIVERSCRVRDAAESWTPGNKGTHILHRVEVHPAQDDRDGYVKLQCSNSASKESSYKSAEMCGRLLGLSLLKRLSLREALESVGNCREG